MRAYLEGIEKILGIGLDSKAIRAYGFSEPALSELRDFAASYEKNKLRISLPVSGLTCYLPFPDIHTGNFRTYNTKGTLDGHWPSFDELANMVMLCDRVIIHDHLGHYAASALDGYVEKYRYAGIRNWLQALAEWKPLIMDDIICILPQDLACSGPMQELYGEGELATFASDLYYYMYPDCEELNSITVAEERLSEYKDLEDFLMTLSIPVNRSGRYGHFYNHPDSLALHELTVEIILKLILKESILASAKKDIDPDVLKKGRIARINFDAFFSAEDFNTEEICHLRKENADFTALRESLNAAARKFAENSSFLQSPGRDFQQYLDEIRLKQDVVMKGQRNRPAPVKNNRRQISLGFAGITSATGNNNFLKSPFNGLQNMLNNLPGRGQLPGSTCHYYFAFHSLD